MLWREWSAPGQWQKWRVLLGRKLINAPTVVVRLISRIPYALIVGEDGHLQRRRTGNPCAPGAAFPLFIMHIETALWICVPSVGGYGWTGVNLEI